VDVNQIEELRRQGLSVCGIAAVTGFDRKDSAEVLGESGAAAAVRTAREAIESARRVQAVHRRTIGGGSVERGGAGTGVARAWLWGGYSTVKEYLQPKRESSRAVAVRRFETPPGRQAQVDWGHLGTLEMDGEDCKLSGFTFTLGYSRMMMAEAALDQKLGTLLRMHEEAFRQLGGVPEEILYDRMKTVWMGIDDRGEVVWHPMFLDFARYWGFTPRLCAAYRAQTKGKVESGIKYMRRNFLCGLLGKEPSGLEDLNGQMKAWVWTIANQRVHGTTHEQPVARWEAERSRLQPIGNRPAVSVWGRRTETCRARCIRSPGKEAGIPVPWQYAGKDVWVQERAGRVEIHCGA
jgi:transposase